MKKFLSILMTAILATAALGAAAEGQTADAAKMPEAIEAFVSLTGVTIEEASVNSDKYLDKVMDGSYQPAPADLAAAQKLAPELPGLSAVTTKDIAVYAVAKQLAPAQVRNAYFRSLANVLKAEIMVNPASEERYKNIQVILSLFLEDESGSIGDTSRAAIRETITKDHVRQIAKEYNLPQGFVEFIVMNDNWDDDDWTNDDDWKKDSDLPEWDTDDRYDDSLEDYVDTDGIDDNSTDLSSQDENSLDMKSFDVSSLDKNSLDVNSADRNSMDVNTPDYNSPASPDYNSPASPDYNSPATPDYNSPATPDYNSPASPDYNSPASPDYNSPATPDYNSPATPDYNSPATPDSPDTDSDD